MIYSIRSIYLAALIVSSALFPAGLFAQKPAGSGANARVEISAEVSSRRISRDDIVVLDVTVTTVVPVRGGTLGGSGYDEFIEPAMEGFNVSGTSTSQSTQITFGSGTAEKVTSHTRKYNLRPTKTGKLRIGPATVRVGNRRYSSRPIVVEVSEGQVPPPAGPSTDVVPPAEDGSVFVQVHADRKTVYLGEQINLSWFAYHESQLVGFAPVRIPSFDEFLVEEIYQIGPKTRSERRVIEGREYGVTPLYKKAVFPKKTGTLKISPLEVRLETVRTRYQLRREAVQRRSAPVELEIKPLPVDGRPDGFSPYNVGDFSISSSVDRNKVKAGEAIVLKLVVEGKGHPADLEIKPLEEIEGFKLRQSEPVVEVESGDVIRGRKVFEYVLIAVESGKREIPPVALAYFNPRSESYHVAETQPLTVEVEGDLKTDTLDGAAAGEVNVLMRSIKPIRTKARIRNRLGYRFHSTWFFNLLVLFPPAVLLGVFFFFRLRERFNRETDAKRWRRVKGKIRQRFRTARRKMLDGDGSGFFAEVSRVLLEIVGEKLGENVRGLTSDELQDLLLSKGFGNDLAEEVIRELQVCDFARFAKAASSTEEMEETLKRVRGVCGRIEKTRRVKADSAEKQSNGK